MNAPWDELSMFLRVYPICVRAVTDERTDRQTDGQTVIGAQWSHGSSQAYTIIKNQPLRQGSLSGLVCMHDRYSPAIPRQDRWLLALQSNGSNRPCRHKLDYVTFWATMLHSKPVIINSWADYGLIITFLLDTSQTMLSYHGGAGSLFGKYLRKAFLDRKSVLFN